VRSKWVRMSWLVLLLTIAVGSAAMASSLFGTSYDLGEEIQFQVQDSTTWWWGCCSCQDSLVLGWRIANSSGQVVYSVIHDAPVSSAIWKGSWLQLDMNGVAVAAGQYKLYVDTSVGTLSKSITLRDPCGCNWCTSTCTSCVSQDVPTITSCSCSTTLVFVEDCNTGFFPFFLWGCNSCSSSSSCGSSSSRSGCSTCP
jgi:hypothetical protein